MMRGDTNSMVGIIICFAFGAIVVSPVKDVIMPPVLAPGKIDLSDLAIVLRGYRPPEATEPAAQTQKKVPFSAPIFRLKLPAPKLHLTLNEAVGYF